MEFQASGFSLAQPQMLHSFGERISGENSCPYSLPQSLWLVPCTCAVLSLCSRMSASGWGLVARGRLYMECEPHPSLFRGPQLLSITPEEPQDPLVRFLVEGFSLYNESSCLREVGSLLQGSTHTLWTPEAEFESWLYSRYLCGLGKLLHGALVS